MAGHDAQKKSRQRFLELILNTREFYQEGLKF